MTAEDREAIKAVIDANMRRLYEQDSILWRRCTECRGELSGWTLECKACAQRHHRRMKEGTHPHPVWYEGRRKEVIAHGQTVKSDKQREIMREKARLRHARAACIR